jgi:hypothetical protein
MAGCFGNDPEDKARERELDKYLGGFVYDDEIEEDDDDDFLYDDEGDFLDE